MRRGSEHATVKEIGTATVDFDSFGSTEITPGKHNTFGVIKPCFAVEYLTTLKNKTVGSGVDFYRISVIAVLVIECATDSGAVCIVGHITIAVIDQKTDFILTERAIVMK